MRIRILAVVGLLLTLPSLATTLSAQRWGRERFPQSGACFFQDRDFRGDYFCVPGGANVGAVPDDMNDKISSIRIFGRAEVVVFRDTRFRGDSQTFRGDIRDLRGEGWNDRMSSMRVDVEGRDGGGRFGDLQDERRGRDRRGEDVDRIVKRAYQDVLGRDPDAAGLEQYRSRVIDDHWTEQQVRDSIRNSPEFRDRLRKRAVDIVADAYRAVLNREPDAGAETYIQNVLSKNWSQQDVERALRNSPEFRNRR
jgi:hypothetical protein